MGLGNIFAHTKLHQVWLENRKVDAPFRTETCCLGQVTVDWSNVSLGFWWRRWLGGILCPWCWWQYSCCVRILHGCFIDFLAWNSGHLVQICAVELPSVIDIPILGHEGVGLSDDHSGHVTPIGQRASGNQNKTDPTVKLWFIHNFLLTPTRNTGHSKVTVVSYSDFGSIQILLSEGATLI